MSRTREFFTDFRMFVDGIPKLKVGDFLRTKGGSVYCVTQMRPSPKYPRRRNLRVLRWPPAEIPADAAVWSLFWYSRNRRPRR